MSEINVPADEAQRGEDLGVSRVPTSVLKQVGDGESRDHQVEGLESSVRVKASRILIDVGLGDLASQAGASEGWI